MPFPSPPPRRTQPQTPSVQEEADSPSSRLQVRRDPRTFTGFLTVKRMFDPSLTFVVSFSLQRFLVQSVRSPLALPGPGWGWSSTRGHLFLPQRSLRSSPLVVFPLFQLPVSSFPSQLTRPGMCDFFFN